MSIEVGSIVDGVVSGITNFGAFINLPENKVGLVHISEVADVYVKDVNDFLKEQDKVKVKILSVDDKGKIALSVKQAQEKKPEERPQQREQRSFNARPQRESFRDMFSKKKYLIQLYNALHPEDKTITQADLEIVTLQSILLNGIYNDLGFMVRGKQLMILVEA